MDIKLKSFKQSYEKRILKVSWFLVPVLAAIALMYWNYASYEGSFSRIEKEFFFAAAAVCTGSSLIFGVWSVVRTNTWRKEEMTREGLIPFVGDRMKTEIPAAGALLGGWLVWNTFADCMGRDLYVLGSVLNTPYEVLRFAGKFCFFLFLLYVSLWLLYRHRVLGTLKASSYLYGRIRYYKERTPLEKQISHKHKGCLIVGGVIQTALAVVIFQEFFRYGESGFLVLGIGVVLVDILFLKIGVSDSLARDTGLLMEQMRVMSWGEAIPENLHISSGSLLYEADSYLANIEESMKKSVEKQMQAERLKVDLITNMSHDLKTPLTSMIGCTDLLKKEALSDTARDYVEIISMKQEQLKDMIQDVFELSKATSNAEPLTMEVLDMRKLFQQILGDMEDQIEISTLRIRQNFSEEPLPFLGDNGKMYRVVQNLLENALKYALPNTRIYIEARKKENKIRACIKNIASYEMDFAPEEIMERFVRGDQSRTTKGHGLGLAIASSYVKNMGGTLAIEIDGDLFKVNMEFPYAEETYTQENGKDRRIDEEDTER